MKPARAGRAAGRARLLAWAGAAVLALGAAAPAGAQPAGGVQVTRTVQGFTRLEADLLQAIRAQDAGRLDALLDGDFEMIVAQDPAEPVVREDWLAAVRRRGAGDWTVHGLSVREFEPVAIVSFVLRPAPGHAPSTALFVVDTWQRAGSGWRLRTRHAAWAGGSRRDIPGDAPAQTIPKKY